MSNLPAISPRPILIIAGEHGGMRPASEAAYAAASQPKELYIVSGANHIDLYDDVSKIPFDRIAMFFMEAFQ